MNFNKKLLIILALSIALIASISAASAVDYSLTNAKIDLEVGSNGLLNVNEAITYHFDSSANGVYRDIPLKQGQSIENLEVYVDGAYAEYKLIDNGNQKRIKVYLYTDSTKAHKISSGSTVTLYLNYDMTNAVKIYNDIGELQYKVWGDEWEEDLENFEATITFPEKSKLKYWINPYENNAESSWTDGELKITSDYLVAGNYIEARAMIPLSEFDNKTPYAKHIDKNGKDEILKIQKNEKDSYNFFNTIFSFADSILGLLCLIPAAVYFKFGREPKTDYQAIYEHEPPTDDPPAYVNAMIGTFSKDVGEVNEEGFQATIMDLINRGKLGVHSEEDTEFTKSTILTIKSTEGLEKYEMELVNILKRFELDGQISLSYMQDSLKSESQARAFKESYDKWCENFKRQCLPESKLSQYFDSKGSNILNYLAFGMIVIAVIAFIIAFIVDYSFTGITCFFAGLLFVVGIISLLLPSGIAGKYTTEGKLYEERWIKFKKYLEDYSLIKEHPPESIAIWNKYLVYATALGVADEVYEAMKMNVYGGSDSFTTNDLFMYYYLGGHHYIGGSFTTASSTISAADNSSVGGIGGGSGGGGGGAF